MTNKIIFLLLMSAVIVTTAYCQGKPEAHLVKSITGTVLGTDAVGNIISIRPDDQQQMSFFVPDKAIITQETHNIGLMDIGKASSVTIQYYVASSSKNVVVSITDNAPVVNQ